MDKHTVIRDRPLRLLVIISLIAIALAFHGWRQVHLSVADSLYAALKSVSMGSVYDKMNREHGTNAYLEVSRWLGVVVEFSALAFVFTAIFSEQWALFKARILFKSHVIVIGESRFADRFGELEGNAVIHLRNLIDAVEQVGQLIRLPFAGRVDESFKTAAAHRARAILVATSDDARTIGLALTAQQHPAVQAQAIPVLVRVHDFWLSGRLHNLPGAERLQAVSEPALAARDAMRRHPAFLSVEEQGADRVHALLVGEPDWLEAMMVELLLSAGTLRYAKPAFTLACAAAAEFRARLFEHYPELAEEADLHFVELGGLHPWELTGFHLASLNGPPVTAVYFLFAEGANAISGYLAFLQQAQLISGFAAPIFVLAESADFASANAGAVLEPLQAVSFGAHSQIVAACGLLSAESGLTEQAYHEAYLAFARPSGEAARAWSQLSEEYRSSNRRAAGHIYAKLFEAGFDVRGWIASHDVWSELPALADGEPLYRDAAERERLAKLEHQRWTSDRRLNGWRYGETRDDLRKTHPDIRPFEQLRPETQEYSRQFVDVLDAILSHRAGGMGRVPAAARGQLARQKRILGTLDAAAPPDADVPHGQRGAMTEGSATAPA